MSNRYRFEKLKNSALHPDDDKSYIFFDMLDTIRHGYVEHTFESALELENILADKEYYIAHKLILTKGKKQLFKGELVKSSKKEILKFLKFSAATDDLRDLLIAP